MNPMHFRQEVELELGLELRLDLELGLEDLGLKTFGVEVVSVAGKGW